MTQINKTVSRKVAIALAILCIITIVALNFAVITYYTDMNSKNSQIQTLNDQIVALQTQVANGTLPTAKLITIGMQYIDNRSDVTSPFLEVTGYVCNVGTGTANNGVLHISATRSDGSVGIDSSVNVESLSSGNYSKVDHIQFPYHGTQLATFSTSLDWGN